MNKVEIVRERLANGRRIADSDIAKLVSIIDKLHARVDYLRGVLQQYASMDVGGSARAALANDAKCEDE